MRISDWSSDVCSSDLIGAADKGTAARHVVERHGLRGVIVLGDDLTDVDMFRAVAEMRAAGRVMAAIIGVGGASDVPPEIVRSEERRVGKECVSPCRSRGAPAH